MHALLSELANYFEKEKTDLYAQIDLTDYEEIGLEPTDVHKSKKSHKDAVQELSFSLAEACRELEP